MVGSDFLKPGQTNRWDTLLNSGERTGAELRHAYNQIQKEIVATRAIVPIADQHDFVPHEPDDPSLNPMADFAGECKGHIQKYLCMKWSAIGMAVGGGRSSTLDRVQLYRGESSAAGGFEVLPDGDLKCVAHSTANCIREALQSTDG